MTEENEVDRKLDEGEAIFRKKHGDEIKEIKFKVDTESIKKELKEKVSLEEQLEQERSLREDYENKLELIGEQKLAEKMNKLGIPEDQREFFRENPERLIGYEVAKGTKKVESGGKGTVPMAREMIMKEHSGFGSAQKEFDSVEEMLEWARVNDKESYEKIKAKSAQGLLENRNYFEWKDHFDENGKSIIGRTLERANQDARRKAGLKE